MILGWGKVMSCPGAMDTLGGTGAVFAGGRGGKGRPVAPPVTWGRAAPPAHLQCTHDHVLLPRPVVPARIGRPHSLQCLPHHLFHVILSRWRLGGWPGRRYRARARRSTRSSTGHVPWHAHHSRHPASHHRLHSSLHRNTGDESLYQRPAFCTTGHTSC